MGSPAQFAHLVNFAAAVRKPGLIPFQTFNAVDAPFLQVIIDLPSTAPTSTTVTTANIAFASNLTINAGAAQVQTIMLSGNIATLTLDGSPVPGQLLTLRFVQDLTGGWTVPLSGIVHDPGFSVDPTPGVVTNIPLRWTGSQWLFYNMGFSAPAP